MLSRELNRIQEIPLENWVTNAKVNAIRGEFMRQCDKLDGLVDGIINNYMACREIFDVRQGQPGRHPWAAKRCPNNKDPNPADTSANACLTDGQIATLEWVYSRYPVSSLANGKTTFGMWLPNTDVSGGSIIANTRFLGQEGAGANAGKYTWLGQLGVTGFLMKNLDANALDYTESKYADRRRELSAILDSTNPDLSAFQKRGGKMIVAIGTNDTTAPPGEQLDYYKSVIDKMGRSKVDEFARFYRSAANRPRTHRHELLQQTVTASRRKPGNSELVRSSALLVDWVEKGRLQASRSVVTGGGRASRCVRIPSTRNTTKVLENQAESYSCSSK